MSSNEELLNESTKKRGEILDGVAGLEEAMNYFISSHFFKTINLDFISKVLEHQYFSLELRIQILGSILKEHYPEVVFPFKEWQELQKIRNIAAHAPKKAEMMKNASTEEMKVIDIFFPYRGERWGVNETFERYQELRTVVRNALNKFPYISIIEMPVQEAKFEELNRPGIIDRFWPKKNKK